MRPLLAGVPDEGFLRRLGLVVFLVAELEGTLMYDLARLDGLPTELNFFGTGGMKLSGMTTLQMGKYFVAHAPKIGDGSVAEYYRVGGEALIEIGPKRNAMLHSRPGIDGNDPQNRLRLVRMRWKETESESHMIDDEWLDKLIERIDELRGQVEAVRPPWSARE